MWVFFVVGVIFLSGSVFEPEIGIGNFAGNSFVVSLSVSFYVFGDGDG